MIRTIQRYTFPSIIALSALSVSASAAFYSVSGLSKLFAGAAFEVIIMAGSLEVSKLVIASLLYRYWNTLNKYLRTYLTVAAVILVLITSMGIYGFLSAAYQETYQKLTVQQNQINFLENKAKFYEDDVIRYDEELKRISNNISTLSNARSQQIQVRDTSVVGGVRTTISTSELRLAQARIKTEEDNRKEVNEKRTVAADSLQKFKLDILSLQNSADTVGELGPLQYLSGLTGTPMDKIINILLLVIIFVFDPLAISLVVAANFAFDKAKPKRNLYGELEDKMEGMRKVVDKYDDLQDEMDIWDSTSQDGLEYEPWDHSDDEYPEPNDDLKQAAVKYKEAVEDRLNDVSYDDNKVETDLDDTKHNNPSQTGYQLMNNIDRVIHKRPSKWLVQLKTGEQIYLSKEVAQKYITKDPDNVINYL